MNIQQESLVERNASHSVRTAVMREIERRGLTPDDLAEVLNLMPTGAKVLLKRPSWPIDLALRIAEALEIEVHFDISKEHHP